MRRFGDESGRPRRRGSSGARQPAGEHGAHTLRIVQGEVVGVHGDDVFVDLGPRMQGVLSVRAFEAPPAVGEQHEFTLGGQEDELWALTLAPRSSESHATWRDMEIGAQVQARVRGVAPEGLELKIGPLHGYMPRSHTGLDRGDDPRQLLGKTFVCEVLEVDAEKERVIVSRKLVLRRERESQHQRSVGSLVPGQVVSGRVSRLEPYGAFVRFGRGLEGLVHVSDLAHERVEHPGALLEKGQTIEVRVLSIKRAGKRIALGLKQMQESPWKRLEATYSEDQVVLGHVTRVLDFGALISIRPGVEGLLHRSQAALVNGASPRSVFAVGQLLAVRIETLDVLAERLSFSRLHRNGSPVTREDATARELLDAHLADSRPGPAGTSLGPLLGAALGDHPDGPGEPPAATDREERGDSARPRPGGASPTDRPWTR